jgi:hypothetical protein
MPNISGVISCSHTVVGSSKQIAASSLESCGLFRLISVIYHVTLLRLDVPHMTAKEIKGATNRRGEPIRGTVSSLASWSKRAS